MWVDCFVTKFLNVKTSPENAFRNNECSWSGLDLLKWLSSNGKNYSSLSRRHGKETAANLFLVILEDFSFIRAYEWWCCISEEWDEMRPCHGKLFIVAVFVCVLMLTSWHTPKSGECHHLIMLTEWMTSKLFGLDIRNVHLLPVFVRLLYVWQCIWIDSLIEL